MKKNYKCKSCGGNLFFDPESQNIKCEYCNSELIINNTTNLPTKNKYNENLKYEVDKNVNQVFECQICNSKISQCSDKDITRCPSCGGIELIQVQENGVHPMQIIPFKISNDKAGELLKKWIHSRKFAPNNLKKMAKLKKISGAYTPIYLFDLNASTKYSATCVNNHKNKQGKIVRSSSYHIHDVENETFTNYIFSANKNFESSIFHKMDGFNYDETHTYLGDYLLGFPGISTDFNVQESYNKVEDEIKENEYRKIKSRLNFRYDEVHFFKADTTISNVQNGYLYVPIWTNHYKYKNKDYHCYINGQTGKVTGKSPKSFWKILGLILGISAIVLLLIFLAK